MKWIAPLSLIAILIVATVALSSCSKTVVYKNNAGYKDNPQRPGPPPHAPAHGYRHKHAKNVVLVYESDLGVYVVEDHIDLYFYKERYYRLRHGSWQVGSHVDGSWKLVSTEKLPQGLKKKGLHSGHGKGKGKKKNK